MTGRPAPLVVLDVAGLTPRLLAHMPRLAAKLHYRMLDVTSWKIVLVEKFDLHFEKKKSHRALDDIRESIGELKFYMQYVTPPAKK